MNHEQQSGNPDEVWRQFSQAEVLASEQLQQAYAEVEADNRHTLYRIAGISDSGFIYNGTVSEGALAPPDLSAPAGNDSLRLRPDMRATLQAQGEHPDVVEQQGDPYVIIGEVPGETKALIARMIAEANADYDELLSTDAHAIWHGNVEGKPIRLELFRKNLTRYNGDAEERVQVVSMRAFREEAAGS